MFVEDFIGQQRWQQYFATVLKENRLAHAYLFSGPAHLGKRTFAFAAARAVICKSRKADGAACTHCSVCLAWQAGNHPDLTVLALAPEERSIGVAAVRDFLANLETTPSLSAHRVAMITDAEHVTTEAWNLLLKTLEEPTSHAVVMVIADVAEQLPATVQSRLQHIQFTPLTLKDLASELGKQGASHEAQGQLAMAAAGRPGLALAWLRDAASFKVHQSESHEFLQLLQGTLAKRFAYTETVATNEQLSLALLTVRLQHWLLVLRDTLVVATNDPELAMTTSADDFQAFVKTAPLAIWFKRYQALEKTIEQLAHNANRRLTLNTFFLTA